MLNQGLGTLPADVTSFVGRRQATVEVKRLLSTSRLVTLTGVGGIGKSRLALHVARDLRRAFADGVFLVELAKLQDPSLLANTVAAELRPNDLSNRDPEAVLVSYLADKRLLLVLDNCEHLLVACARLVARLLPVASELKVLATSREPLGLTAEHVWPVPPLSVPSLDTSLPHDGSEHRYEALALFEERAAAAAPGFTLNRDNETAVAQLCQRLDGLPLAIELAAVRLRALTVEDILEHLEDRFRLLTKGDRAAPARHQTLLAAVEWSFDRCTELERTLWAQLSVFAGEFDLAAAQEVCADDGVLAEDVFTGVAGLVDKSLLIRVEGAASARYGMLETIRQYGRDQLSYDKEVVVRRRHRDYYLRLAEQAEADWFGPNQVEWLNQFQAEQPNLWAALEFCLTQPGQARTGLRMAGALYWYWVVRAVRDGRRWLERALVCDTEPSPERAKALWAVGWTATCQGDTTYARSVLKECVDLAQALDDEIALGHALHFIGLARTFDDDPPEAVQALEQALAHYRSAGVENALTVVALSRLGTTMAALGDNERAVALCQECITACEARGEKWSRAWGLRHLAFIRWLQHDRAQASAAAKEALRLQRAFHDQIGIAWCVETLAWIAAEGDAQRAAVLFGTTRKLWEQLGGWLGGWQTGQNWSNRCKAQARRALGQRAFDTAVQRGTSFSHEQALAYALGEQQTAPPAAAVPASELPLLTQREREVATLVAQGLSNKNIAAQLVISQRTAESHIEHILLKLGFTSRTQIVAWIAKQPDN